MYLNNLYFMYPFLPPNCQKPPTLYAVLNSIVNGNKEEDDYTKIKDLAKEGRNTIFNFEYPLTNNISKEKFETMILNHFLQRRIGFETVTAFRIQLDVKLNEIMPLYNKMFDALENWDIFNDGEITTRIGRDDKTQNSTQNFEENSNTNTSNQLTNSSTTNTSDTSDRRNSELPQNELDELRDGNYVTNYNYDTNSGESSDVSSTNGSSTLANNSTNKTTNNSIDNTIYNETITRTPSDKISIMKEMQENIKSIYTMIFDDLDCLFYQLV